MDIDSELLTKFLLPPRYQLVEILLRLGVTVAQELLDKLLSR
jgi:hypothetical protein